MAVEIRKAGLSVESGLTGLESAMVRCRSRELLLQGLFGAERALCGGGATVTL